MRVQLRTSVAPGPAPTFLTVFPTSGPTVGGQNVQVTGINFRAGAIVYFNGNPAFTSFVSAGVLTAITPAGTAGPATVAVQNSDGTNTGTEGANAYTYTGSGGRMLGSGLLPVAMADANQNVSSGQVTANAIVDATGALTLDRNLTFPAPASNALSYDMQVRNSTTGGHNIVVTTGAGTSVSIPPGLSLFLTFDPTGVWESNTGV